MTNINWTEKARLWIATFTKKNTPLTALHYFNERIDGPDKFVEMVSEAMEISYKEGFKMGKRTQKKEDAEVS